MIWKPINLRVVGAFVAGVAVTTILHISSTKASTSVEPAGTFFCVGTYSSWGKQYANGRQFEYNELTVLNLSLKTQSVIVNKASYQSVSEPNFSQGPVESGQFTISAGPLPGTYKLNYDVSDYAIIAPVNSGNSLFLIDPGAGMTGTCQKV